MKKHFTLLLLIYSLFIFNAHAQAPAIEWQKCLGGTINDYAESIQQTADGGYIVAGWSYSNDGDVSGNHGNEDYWVTKINNVGTIEWQKSLGGSNYDQAFSVGQTSDGGYIVAGVSTSINGDVTGNHGAVFGDIWVVKLDNLGSIQWQKCLGGTNGERAQAIQQTSDGGYIVGGCSKSTDGDVTGNHGNWDYWVVKLNNSGSIQWQKSLGGSGPELAYSIEQTTDGGYFIVGHSESNDGDVSGHHGPPLISGSNDYWVVKLDNTG